MLADVLPFLAIPAVAAVLGGVVAAFRPPGRRLQSVIQHFAGGVVFAAVAGELLPELMYEAAAIPTIIGFAVGVGLMLGVKKLTEGGPAEGADDDGTRGLVTTVAIDMVIDGLLVGVGFAAGAEAGLVVTIALSLEVLFLVLATAAALVGAGLTPCWFVGRHAIPARERLPLGQLGWNGHVATLRRGARWWLEALPSGHPARGESLAEQSRHARRF